MFYFYSALPSAIKINGKYCGTATKNLLSLVVKDGDLVEVLPIDCDRSFFWFIAGKDFDCQFIDRFFLKEDVFVCVKNFPPANRDFSLPIKRQTKVANEEISVAVIIDSSIKLIIETNTNMQILPLTHLPNKLNTYEICNLNGLYLIIELISKKRTVIALKTDEKLKLCFKKTVDFLSVSDVVTTKTFADTLRCHEITTKWQPSNPFKLMQSDANCKFSIENFKDNLLPFLFMEELSVGGSLEDFLTEDLLADAVSLKEYVGTIETFFVSPYEENQLIALAQGKPKIFKFDLEKRKICNLTILNE